MYLYLNNRYNPIISIIALIILPAYFFIVTLTLDYRLSKNNKNSFFLLFFMTLLQIINFVFVYNLYQNWLKSNNRIIHGESKIIFFTGVVTIPIIMIILFIINKMYIKLRLK